MAKRVKSLMRQLIEERGIKGYCQENLANLIAAWWPAASETILDFV